MPISESSTEATKKATTVRTRKIATDDQIRRGGATPNSDHSRRRLVKTSSNVTASIRGTDATANTAHSSPAGTDGALAVPNTASGTVISSCDSTTSARAQKTARRHPTG